MLKTTFILETFCISMQCDLKKQIVMYKNADVPVLHSGSFCQYISYTRYEFTVHHASYYEFTVHHASYYECTVHHASYYEFTVRHASYYECTVHNASY